MATLELVRQVEVRHQVGSSRQRLRTARSGETLAAMLRGVEADLPNVGITLRGMLRADGERWAGRAGLPEVVEDLLREEVWIDTQYKRDVEWDWNGLIALAFVEKLKTDEWMRTVFYTQLLADAAANAKLDTLAELVWQFALTSASQFSNR